MLFFATCPDVRIQGSGSEVSDILGGSTRHSNSVHFLTFLMRMIESSQFWIGGAVGSELTNQFPMLSKYIDMYYTLVQLAQKGSYDSKIGHMTLKINLLTTNHQGWSIIGRSCTMIDANR